MKLYSILVATSQILPLYIFFFFHSHHYLCLSLNPSDSAFFFVSFSLSLVWCFTFSFLLLIHLHSYSFAGQKIGTTCLPKDITKQSCVLVVSVRRYVKCSSLYPQIICKKTTELLFLGRILGYIWRDNFMVCILDLLSGSIKKTKESRSSIPKFKPRISTIRKDFHCYQRPFIH